MCVCVPGCLLTTCVVRVCYIVRSEKTLEDEELKKLLQTALKPKKKNKKKNKKVR